MNGYARPLSGHPPELKASDWVSRYAPVLVAPRNALDLACGGGRHTRLLVSRGYTVTAVDRDLSTLQAGGAGDFETVCADLEGAAWPLRDRVFDLVVVTNYLHRPLFPAIIGAVAPGGSLIYETFAVGNERLGRPTNPDFLLGEDELIERVRGHLIVRAYEYGEVGVPKPAVVQRIFATCAS
jgi:SAM-dependent methyltransferase